ncbi:hypothetical protein K466DRAFT_94275 [Polyporus arcularius HHB13444]|uniref:Uncharacterized protein n=1 Tax=Polyporus arcularius HHB13444 TaxID=1314778 RepID=A0A5C3PI68_9APHY|nr:hypothetical protein K466DRAFT_94275 [Polyporus arcularius HHB13444]
MSTPQPAAVHKDGRAPRRVKRAHHIDYTYWYHGSNTVLFCLYLLVVTCPGGGELSAVRSWTDAKLSWASPQLYDPGVDEVVLGCE